MTKNNPIAKKSTSLAPSPSPEGSLTRYLQDIKKYPLLEAEEEYMLAKQYADHDDTDAAHKLVTSHLRLVAKISTGYSGYGLPLGDVISEGNIGLMQAVKKFDAERGFRLATYAMWWIRASIQEYVLRSWSLVKIGTTAAQKKLFFNLRKLKQKINILDNKSLHPDDVSKISQHLDVKEEEVIMMNERMTGKDYSLNAPMNNNEQNAGEWQDWLEDKQDNQETILVEKDEYKTRQLIIKEAFSVLKKREVEILNARRLQNTPATLKELSKIHNVSCERIRQIENGAFEKLRKAITQKEITQDIENNIITKN